LIVVEGCGRDNMDIAGGGGGVREEVDTCGRKKEMCEQCSPHLHLWAVVKS
jgi:hypothetical protein